MPSRRAERNRLAAPAQPARQYRCICIGMLCGIAMSLMVPGAADAQTPSPPGSRLTMQRGDNVSTVISKDPLGKPCADIEVAARAHTTNPEVFDHVVSVVNRCLKPLTLRVCYFNSDRCFDLTVPGTKRKDLVLGVFPGMKHFRVSYKEMKMPSLADKPVIRR